jgi:hypothetical protein
MCRSCNVIRINGILCHETECPDAWRDYERECVWCGSEFIPESQYQNCCSHSCYVAYHGLYCDCQECNPISITDPYGFHVE